MKHTNHTLLMSVTAAALTVGMGVAFAQAPAAQQNAPAEKQQSAPAEKIAPALEPSKGAAPDVNKSGQAADKADKKDGKAAQDNGMKPKTTASETKSPEAPRKGKTSSEMKSDGKATSDVKSGSKLPEKTGDAKNTTETRPATTGQGAAAGSAKLSTEQRTTIRSAIRKQKVRPATNINFSISIGTRVPRDVRFYRVPLQLVEIYPSWRGYDYFLVGDQIVVVNPRTHEIVAVLDA